MDDAAPLLSILMDDMGRQKGVHRPGPYWARSAAFAAKEMRKRGIADFRSSTSGVIGQGYTDSLTLDPSYSWAMGSLPRKILKTIIDASPVRRGLFKAFDDHIRGQQAHIDGLEGQLFRVLHESRLIANGLLEKLPDTLHGGCESTVRIGGKTVSRHYLNTLFQLENLSRAVDFTKVRAVFEIGGGFGANAHLLMHLYPNIRKYLYLDIPPMLYVGTQYLRHFYTNAVIDYEKTRSLDKILFSDNDEREILAVAPWQIEKTQLSFDLFFNSYSMQEMPDEVVANYAAHIKRMAAPGAKLCLLTYDMKSPEDGRLEDEAIFRHFKDNFHVSKIEFPAVPMIGGWRRLHVLSSSRTGR